MFPRRQWVQMDISTSHIRNAGFRKKFDCKDYQNSVAEILPFDIIFHLSHVILIKVQGIQTTKQNELIDIIESSFCNLF